MYDLTNTKSSTILIRFKATLQICDTLPSVLGNFPTSKIATAALTINCLCCVLNRGQTIPTNPDCWKQGILSGL